MSAFNLLAVAGSLYKYLPFLNRKYSLVSRISSGTLLNLGCGRGRLEKVVLGLNAGIRITSVDIEDYKGCLDREVDFYRLDISRERLPFQDNSFDMVSSVHVLEHLRDPVFTLRETARVLQKGGTVYVETPSTRSLRLPSLNSWLGRGNPLNFFDDPTHLHPFSRKTLRAMLEEAGLSVTETGYARDWPSVILSPFLVVYGFLFRKRNIFTWGVWQLVGWSVYAVAVKK